MKTYLIFEFETSEDDRTEGRPQWMIDNAYNAHNTAEALMVEAMIVGAIDSMSRPRASLSITKRITFIDSTDEKPEVGQL